ncbi:MAG: PGF-pre-PGF domain-containing protein [Candidatus Nitrosocaldaceae archaeon]
MPKRVINYRKPIIAAMTVLIIFSYSNAFAQYGGGGGGTSFTILGSSIQTLSGQNPEALISGICAIEKIIIKLDRDGGTFVLSALEITKPSGIPAAPGENICYYRITIPEHIKAIMREAEIHLKVPKSSLGAIDVDSLKLYRLNEVSNTWEALSIEKIREDGSFVYYVARTSRFSFFALSGEKMVAPPEEIFEETFTVEGFDVSVTLTSGKVENVDLNIDEKSLNLMLANVEDDATLTIEIPRGLLDAKNPDDTDTEFSIIIDGELFEYEETSDANKRVLTIEIPAFSEEVSIFGTFVVPEFGTIAIIILAASIFSVLAVRRKLLNI